MLAIIGTIISRWIGRTARRRPSRPIHPDIIVPNMLRVFNNEMFYAYYSLRYFNNERVYTLQVSMYMSCNFIQINGNIFNQFKLWLIFFVQFLENFIITIMIIKYIIETIVFISFVGIEHSIAKVLTKVNFNSIFAAILLRAPPLPPH